MSEQATGIGSQTTVAARTLKAIVDHSSCLETVRREDLRHGDWVVVSTKNSVYTLCVVDEGGFSVSGGWFDRHADAPVRMAINGCTWGGSVINHDIVAAPGLFLEFGNRVMTTRIQQVKIFRSPRPETLN